MLIPQLDVCISMPQIVEYIFIYQFDINVKMYAHALIYRYILMAQIDEYILIPPLDKYLVSI